MMRRLSYRLSNSVVWEPQKSVSFKKKTRQRIFYFYETFLAARLSNFIYEYFFF